jgi:hypothetical protein
MRRSSADLNARGRDIAIGVGYDIGLAGGGGSGGNGMNS